jgi:pimeloyl-ACP methyl ester carboxylesterase
MPYATVEDKPVYYVTRRGGAAGRPPLVFIHGAGGSHQHWLYVLRALHGVTGLALDLPGHGRSAGVGRDSVPAYADWLVAFLDSLDASHAVLVGHSLGGAVALDTALRYPERVAGLGLVGSGARLRVAPAIIDGLRQDPEPTVRLICEWCYAPDASPAMLELSETQMLATGSEVLRRDFAACNAFDVIGRLGEITCPAAIITGSEDRMTPVKYAEFLRDQLPHAALHVVDGAGHMVMIERPQAVAGAVQSLASPFAGHQLG